MMTARREPLLKPVTKSSRPPSTAHVAFGAVIGLLQFYPRGVHTAR